MILWLPQDPSEMVSFRKVQVPATTLGGGQSGAGSPDVVNTARRNGLSCSLGPALEGGKPAVFFWESWPAACTPSIRWASRFWPARSSFRSPLGGGSFGSCAGTSVGQVVSDDFLAATEELLGEAVAHPLSWLGNRPKGGMGKGKG